MGGSVSCGDSVSVHVDFKSQLFTLGCEESCIKHEQSSYGNTKKNVKEIFVEDIDCSTSEEENFNDLMIKELGVSLSETLHIHDPPEPLCFRNLHQENTCNQLEVNSPSFDTDVLEGLSKRATILYSELVQSYLANSDGGDGFSCAAVPNENFSEAENLAYASQLPTTKLIPALKGSRAQHGIHLNIKLTVKWAPEVYDPPVTSSSHTVKGHHRQHHHHHHHHRSKAKKDHHNYWHSKGRSSSGSVSERKYSHRRSSGSSLTDPRTSRLQALGCNEPLRTSCSQAKTEHLNVAVKTCEVIKYGSTCYMESFAPMQLPVAKVA